MGTQRVLVSYRQPSSGQAANIERRWTGEPMKEATDIFRVVGIILLAVFVIAVGIPIVLTAAGLTLGLIKILFGIAVFVIKLAVVIAVAYLILVGIRAVLK